MKWTDEEKVAFVLPRGATRQKLEEILDEIPFCNCYSESDDFCKRCLAREACEKAMLTTKDEFVHYILPCNCNTASGCCDESGVYDVVSGIVTPRSGRMSDDQIELTEAFVTKMEEVDDFLRVHYEGGFQDCMVLNCCKGNTYYLVRDASGKLVPTDILKPRENSPPTQTVDVTIGGQSARLEIANGGFIRQHQGRAFYNYRRRDLFEISLAGSGELSFTAMYIDASVMYMYTPSVLLIRGD